MIRLRRHQQGVTTLIIVAALFFVLSLVAAYANRSVLFEQRTASNLVRAMQAQDAAEAGLEWALAMLNGGRIDENCAPTADVSKTSFRQRYLAIDPDNGTLAPVVVDDELLYPTCVYDGDGGWSCSCPSNGAPSVTAPSGSEIYPAFRIRIWQKGVAEFRPGMIWLEANGCTRLDETCLSFTQPRAVAGEGRATVRSLVSLRGAIGALPAAAFTVRGDVRHGHVYAFNPAPGAGSLALAAKGTVSAVTHLGGAPGTPADDPRLLSELDGALVGLDQDRTSDDAEMTGPSLFTSIFSTYPDVWREQPAALRVDCSLGCAATQVRELAVLNPGRVLWLDGDVGLDSGAAIGSPNDPVVIVATGNVDINVDVYGFVYSNADSAAPSTWERGGAGTVIGAVMAPYDTEDVDGDSSFSVIYDADVLNRVRWTSGSFVRVPGGWYDWDRGP